jgi:hypothetical protein
MLLTPLAWSDFPDALAGFAAALPRRSLAGRAMARIRGSLDRVEPPAAGSQPPLSRQPRHHRQALALLADFGVRSRPGPPQDGVTWDGRRLAAAMEPSVLLHDLAHFQLAPPSRRGLVDFGLGAGPETGDVARADGCRRRFGVDCDREEALASLLGVLWETALGQPAVLAFIEQNWLEGCNSSHNLAHFTGVVERLARHGFLDRQARPTRQLRQAEDDLFTETD